MHLKAKPKPVLNEQLPWGAERPLESPAGTGSDRERSSWFCSPGEYRLCLAVHKMSQKETTRAITSSSDKLHQTEREQMNEELLNGSFQRLILQLKAGVVVFPLRHSELLSQGEAEPGIPFGHR